MTEPEGGPVPEPDPAASDAAQEAGVRLLEARALELQKHIQNFSADLQSLAQNLEARKRETTALKIMFYTGVVVLMLAFFYSSNALYRAQLESFENNLDHLQTLTGANLTALQRGLMQDIQDLKIRVQDLEQGQGPVFVRERRLGEVLMSMNEAIRPLAGRSADWAQRVGALHQDSDELFGLYQQYASDHALPPRPAGSHAP